MAAAYAHLHSLGHAHSLEVWSENRLVGGLYGVQRGGLFAAESMFHRKTDMSKVALVYCLTSLQSAGIGLFDVQFLTDHLASLGAQQIGREDYLQRVAQQRTRAIDIRKLRIISPFHGQQSG
jgi:leucyl/phenylalanyl-tRNA--protein transferase